MWGILFFVGISRFIALYLLNFTTKNCTFFFTQLKAIWNSNYSKAIWNFESELDGGHTPSRTNKLKASKSNWESYIVHIWLLGNETYDWETKLLYSTYLHFYHLYERQTQNFYVNTETSAFYSEIAVALCITVVMLTNLFRP